MDPRDLDALARRANTAGFQTIPDYCASLVRALEDIANAESGPWGRLASQALNGSRRYDGV